MPLGWWSALATVALGVFALALAVWLGAGGDPESPARDLVVGAGAMFAATVLGAGYMEWMERREARSRPTRIVSLHDRGRRY